MTSLSFHPSGLQQYYIERHNRQKKQETCINQIKELFSKSEAELASFMNNYFASHGWQVHEEVWGTGPDGKRVRLDALLVMKEGVFCSTPQEFWPAYAIGIEYKQFKKWNTDLSGKVLSQLTSYAQTVWDVPDSDACDAHQARLPIFLCPGWSRVGPETSNRYVFPERMQPLSTDLEKFIGREGIGRVRFAYDYRGDLNIDLDIRSSRFWQGYEKPTGRHDYSGKKSYVLHNAEFCMASTWKNLVKKSGHQ